MKKYITQKEIIELLKTGEWEIGYSSSFNNTYHWMQKGGLGKGGESIKIHGNTFWAMHRNRLIKKISDGYGTQKFKLKTK